MTRLLGLWAVTRPPCAGTIKAYFRGNGVNVVKIAPETALRLTLNDRIKAVVAKNHMERITPWERMACGGLAGASAQVALHISHQSVSQCRPDLKLRVHGMQVRSAVAFNSMLPTASSGDAVATSFTSRPFC